MGRAGDVLAGIQAPVRKLISRPAIDTPNDVRGVPFGTKVMSRLIEVPLAGAPVSLSTTMAIVKSTKASAAVDWYEPWSATTKVGTSTGWSTWEDGSTSSAGGTTVKATGIIGGPTVAGCIGERGAVGSTGKGFTSGAGGNAG